MFEKQRGYYAIKSLAIICLNGRLGMKFMKKSLSVIVVIIIIVFYTFTSCDHDLSAGNLSSSADSEAAASDVATKAGSTTSSKTDSSDSGMKINSMISSTPDSSKQESIAAAIADKDVLSVMMSVKPLWGVKDQIVNETTTIFRDGKVTVVKTNYDGELISSEEKVIGTDKFSQLLKGLRDNRFYDLPKTINTGVNKDGKTITIMDGYNIYLEIFTKNETVTKGGHGADILNEDFGRCKAAFRACAKQ